MREKSLCVKMRKIMSNVILNEMPQRDISKGFEKLCHVKSGYGNGTVKVEEKKTGEKSSSYNMCRVFYSVTSELERANFYPGLVNHT